MNSFAEGQNNTESVTHRSNCFNALLNIKDDLSQIYQNTVARNQLDEALLSVLGLLDKYEGDLQNDCKFAIAEAMAFLQSWAENKGKIRESIEFYYPHLIRNSALLFDSSNIGDYHLAGLFFGGLSETLQGRSTFYAKVEQIDPKNHTTFDLEKFLPNFFSPFSKTFRKSTIPPKKISDCLVNASSQFSASSISKDSNLVIILEFFRHFNDCANANQIDLRLLVQDFYQPFLENFRQSSLKFIKNLGKNFPTVDSRLRDALAKLYEGDYSVSGKDVASIVTTLFHAIR